MPCVHHFENTAYAILVWEITETDKALQDLLHASSALHVELDAIKSDKRRLERLATYCLLQYRYPTQLAIQYDAYGKPLLSNGDHLSISHSGSFVGVMVSKTDSVALDIEQLDPNAVVGSGRIFKVSKKFINDAEMTFVAPHDLVAQEFLQTVIWSSKEVLFKMYSKGGLDFKKHMHVSAFKPVLSGFLNAALIKDDYSATYKLGFEDHGRWLMVFASAADQVVSTSSTHA